MEKHKFGGFLSSPGAIKSKNNFLWDHNVVSHRLMLDCFFSLNNVFSVISEGSMSHCNLVSVYFLYYKIFYTHCSEITCLISCLLSNSVWYIHKKWCHFWSKEKTYTPQTHRLLTLCFCFAKILASLLRSLDWPPVIRPKTRNSFPQTDSKATSLFYRYLLLWLNITTVKKTFLCRIY